MKLPWKLNIPITVLPPISL